MSRIKAPANLPELVRSAFARARSEGDLHYFPTQVTILLANSIPVSPQSCIFLRKGMSVQPKLTVMIS